MSFMGYADEDAFRQAVGREMDQMSTHSNVEGRRPGQQRPAPERSRAARPPDTRGPISEPQRSEGLKGKPGSVERIRQVRAYAPELWDQAQREQRAGEIGMLLDAWAQAGPGEYDAEVIYELARGVHDVGDGDMLNAVLGAVNEMAGEEAAEYYVGLLHTGHQNQMAREQQEYEQADQQRVQSVQEQLTDEYRTIEDKLGPAGLEAADEIAKQVHEAGLLYDPDVDPEQVRVALRAAGEVGRAEEYTGNVWETVRAIGEEMKRTYGPSGDDESRAIWESKMDNADLEIAERAHAYADPTKLRSGRCAQEPLSGPPRHRWRWRSIRRSRACASTRPMPSTGRTYTRRTSLTGRARMTRPVARRPT